MKIVMYVCSYLLIPVYVFLQPLTMDPLLKIVLVQTHSELSETDNLRDESELIVCEVCTESNLSMIICI